METETQHSTEEHREAHLKYLGIGTDREVGAIQVDKDKTLKAISQLYLNALSSPHLLDSEMIALGNVIIGDFGYQYQLTLTRVAEDKIPSTLNVFSEVKKTKNNKDKPMNSLLQFFEYEHLPPHLQSASKPFWELATMLDTFLPDGAEKTVALRKLLESKDCAVRAVVADENTKDEELLAVTNGLVALDEIQGELHTKAEIVTGFRHVGSMAIYRHQGVNFYDFNAWFWLTGPLAGEIVDSKLANKPIWMKV